MVGQGAVLPHPGTALLVATGLLLAAALVGWVTARRAERNEGKGVFG